MNTGPEFRPLLITTDETALLLRAHFNRSRTKGEISAQARPAPSVDGPQPLQDDRAIRHSATERGFRVNEEHRPDPPDSEIDRRFAAIVQNLADEVEPGELGEHAQPSTTFGEGKPIWYLVPLRMLCTIAFFMTLSSCIVAYGGVMNDARWGTATLIALCVAVGTGVCRRTAKARFDRRSR